MQLIKEIRKPIEATTDHPKRVDYEYERAGTANIFMFTEPLSGWREATARQAKQRLIGPSKWRGYSKVVTRRVRK